METPQAERRIRQKLGDLGIEPTLVRNRKDLIRFLAQSLTSDYLTIEEDEIRQSATYVNSYLIEISKRASDSRLDILREQFAHVSATDDPTIYLAQGQNGTAFFVDTIDERFVVLHSIDRTDDTDMVIRHLTEGDQPGFDSSWLPTQFLLNSHIGSLRGFKFSHESLAGGVDWAAELAPEDEPPVDIVPSSYRVATGDGIGATSSLADYSQLERGPVRGSAKRAALTIRDSATAERDYHRDP